MTKGLTMSIDADLLLDVWRLFEDFIPNNKKDDVAETFVAILMDNDPDSDMINDVIGEDVHIDRAIDRLRDDEELEEEEDY
jgi:hypothetical protein